MFSCEFCEISKSTFSYRTHAVAASGKVVIQSRTCGYVELSEVRPSYPEYPTLNIGTNWRPASYKSYSGWNVSINAMSQNDLGAFTLNDVNPICQQNGKLLLKVDLVGHDRIHLTDKIISWPVILHSLGIARNIF